MWKDISKITLKLIALILPFFILLPLYCRFFPMYYLDDEYAMYRQQKDYVTGKQNMNEAVEVMASGGNTDARILVMGDSRTKAGFKPDLLWEGTYNIALGGGTPIEGYYSLKEYLLHHEAPETVVMAYAPMHYMDVDTLWTRSVYFHTLSEEDFRDLTKRAAEFEDTEKILVEDYELEYLMYKFYLPNKYATALKKSAFVMRHKKTSKKYNIMVEFDGYSTYGTAEQSGDINGEAKVSDFEDSDIITWYLKETFALCSAHDIKVILEQTPMNETSYGILTPEFKAHYREYMEMLSEEYPHVGIYANFYVYPNDCFGDADHLNAHGVEVYDAFIMDKYGDL